MTPDELAAAADELDRQTGELDGLLALTWHEDLDPGKRFELRQEVLKLREQTAILALTIAAAWLAERGSSANLGRLWTTAAPSRLDQDHAMTSAGTVELWEHPGWVMDFVSEQLSRGREHNTVVPFRRRRV